MTGNEIQPNPKKGTGVYVWDLVMADIRERDLTGLQKYKTRLEVGNGRDALTDAYQESLDQTVYLRQEMEDKKTLMVRLTRLTNALAMIYYKWENGDSCYEDPDDCTGYLGRAVKLSTEEENGILELIR